MSFSTSSLSSSQSETALEDLEQYPEEPEVHKYLHRRLMAFDVGTLYELHYLMITLGKVKAKAIPTFIITMTC
jgi:hypothetical protein